jgi:hypothetical protein
LKPRHNERPVIELAEEAGENLRPGVGVVGRGQIEGIELARQQSRRRCRSSSSSRYHSPRDSRSACDSTARLWQNRRIRGNQDNI